jgi:hypothetical protein
VVTSMLRTSLLELISRAMASRSASVACAMSG